MATNYKEWVKALRTHAQPSVFPDYAVRGEPQAVDLPESLGFYAAKNIPGLEKLEFLQRSFLNEVLIENQTTLSFG